MSLKRGKFLEAFEILKVAANAVNERKARDMFAVEVGEITILAEYLLMATATSSTHVRALAEEVECKLSELGVEPHHVEGKATGWILLDYNEVIVHIFSREAREFYSLDRMWSDGNVINLDDILTSEQED
ncbi:MAG: ribosome silencing factor [Clostridia bacterium]|nr:ribosome silencing factor [Clostridia bacterium]MBR3593807.1 ribosome silencing factor [Clostridia bacterium]